MFKDGSSAAQLLAYPVTDLSTKHAWYRLFADGFLLTERDMDWFRPHCNPVSVSPLSRTAMVEGIRMLKDVLA